MVKIKEGLSNFENDNSNVPNPNEEITDNKMNEHTVNEQIISKPQDQEQAIVLVEQFEQKTAGFWMRFWAFIID